MRFRTTKSGSYYWQSRNKTYSINVASRYTDQGVRNKYILWVKLGKATPTVCGLFDDPESAQLYAVDHHNGAIAPLSS